MDRITLEISWSSLWRILLFVILATIIFKARQILLGLFLALVISSGLEALVNFLENQGLPRTLGVILVFLLSIFLVIFLIYLVIPLIIIDVNGVLTTLNSSGSSATWLTSLTTLETARSANLLVSRFTSQFFGSGTSPLEAFSRVVGGVALAVSVFVSSFYLSLSRDGVERFIRAVFPSSSEEAALRIYARSRRKIGFWFRTQVMLNCIIALLVWGVLTILGVRHAFLIGLLAGLFELVPFVGPILAGSIAFISAFTTSVELALVTLVAFLAIHQLESHVLVPLLTNRAVGLHPVIVIVALLIGSEIGGILGIVISVPAAAVLQEVVEEWSSRKPRALHAGS